MVSANSTDSPRDRARFHLEQALKSGIRGKNREAVAYALEVLLDDGRGRITDTHCRNLRHGDKPLRIPDCPGLTLVANRHNKVWRMRHRVDGAEKTETLGEYPTLSLTDAAAAWKAKRSGGQADVAPESTMTVRELCDRYMALARERKRSWKEDHRQLTFDAIPAWGDRLVTSITPDDVSDLLSKVYKRGSPRSAEKLLALLRFVFNVAAARGKGRKWLAAADLKAEPWVAMPNPCESVVLPDRDTRGLALNEKQLRRYLKRLPSADMPDSAKQCLTLQLLTASRLGEVAELPWDEVDLEAGVWTLPAARAKNGQQHLVMLSKQALALLEQRRKNTHGDFVFPAQRAEGKPLSVEYVAHALADNREHLEVPEAFVSHSLRHTCLTHLASMKCPRETRLRVANHKPNRRSDMDARYNAREYDDDAREWLQKWADRLDVLASDKVLPRACAMVRAMPCP
jgi:integrase